MLNCNNSNTFSHTFHTFPIPPFPIRSSVPTVFGSKFSGSNQCTAYDNMQFYHILCICHKVISSVLEMKFPAPYRHTSLSLLSSCSKQTRGKGSEMVLHHLVFQSNKWRKQWSETQKKKSFWLHFQVMNSHKSPPTCRKYKLLRKTQFQKQNVQPFIY